MENYRIAIAGTLGSMGRNLIEATQQAEGVKISAALVRLGSSFVGRDVGEVTGLCKKGVIITDNLQSVMNDFDVLVDFTRPEGTLYYLGLCREYKKAMVIGTTGFDKGGKAAIQAAAADIGIVFSANFSVGINLVLKLIEKTAKVMGDYADIEIVEAHHRHKVDAPSGTALAMGEAIADAMSWNFDEHVIYARKDYTGERKPQTIGFATVRAGDIIGDHTAMFADIGERVEITHKASSRMIFAKGAVKAALWLKDKKSGMYDMHDVLDLSML